jgi:outer membrane protein assembly factor BamB
MTGRSSIAKLTVGFTILFLSSIVRADDWPQWRGPQRDGVSQEKGLLKEWPATGPKLIWHVTDLGSGFSTPSVVGNRLYLLSNNGTQDELVKALSAIDGKPIWSTRIGRVGNPTQQPSYPAARSTPTVDGDLLYALGSDGDLVCLETATGKVRWKKNLRTDFGGQPGVWAYAESPLIDGDTLVCTPGGKTTTLIALDKRTGATAWMSASTQDQAAYASGIVVEAAGVKQ